MNLRYRFSAKAPGRKSPQLSVIVADSRNYRLPYVIPELANASLTFWSAEHQRFLGGTQADVDNNKILDGLRVLCDELVNNSQIATPKDFVEALRKGVAPKEVLTLGEYIESIIERERQNPTNNYRLYLSLLRNLRGESHKAARGKIVKFDAPMLNGVRLVDVPIGDVTDEHLITFANWINTSKGGGNYKNLCSNMVRVLSYAREEKKNTNTITFSKGKYKKKAVTTDTNRLHGVFTDKQMCMVKAMQGYIDNKVVRLSKEKQELYYDTCMLMYYTLSRPADVILFHNSMLQTAENGAKYLCYIPFKKRTYKDVDKHIVRVPLNTGALAIIEKYRDMSKAGYLLPLEHNNVEWDVANFANHAEWHVQCVRTEKNINRYLKHLGRAVGADFDVNMYTFRKTAISTAVNAGQPANLVAKRAGTSAKMIEMHYYKDTNLNPIEL